MRSLKTILYYITVAASALYIALLAIAPFGGHNFMLELWRYGLYSNLADASEHILLFRFRQFLGVLFSLAPLFACSSCRRDLAFCEITAGAKV